MDTLELGAELAGSAGVAGRARQRPLAVAAGRHGRVTAQRTGGIGDYELQLRFDPARMDATLKMQEPANGPLENLLTGAGAGRPSVVAQAERAARRPKTVELTLDAGAAARPRQRQGQSDDTSADLEYSLDAPK